MTLPKEPTTVFYVHDPEKAGIQFRPAAPEDITDAMVAVGAKALFDDHWDEDCEDCVAQELVTERLRDEARTVLIAALTGGQ